MGEPGVTRLIRVCVEYGGIYQLRIHHLRYYELEAKSWFSADRLSVWEHYFYV